MMKSKRIVCLIMISVIIFSSLSTFNNSTKAQEGEYVDSIIIEVRTNRKTALDEVASGNLDVFTYPISGDRYDSLSDSLKEKMNTWTSIGEYNSVYFNPAHTVSPYEVMTDEGEYRFNPFAMKKVRNAFNYMIDRMKIVNEIYNGFAEPRYIWEGVSTGTYDEYFEEVVEDYNLTSFGDKQKGIQMIEEAMISAKNDPDLKGELRSPENSSSDYWEYKALGENFEPIEMIGYLESIEGKKEDLGYYIDRLIKDAGMRSLKIMGWRNPEDIVYYGDPADMEWNFYIESWQGEGAQYYQEEKIAKLYSGWYGYMPGGRRPDADYRYGYEVNGTYYGNRTLENVTQQLVNGQVNSLDGYWNKMVQATEIALNQSVRVFMTSKYDYYGYDKDRILHAATDVLTGWSDVFTPRTMMTPDGNLTMAQYSSQGVLYQDPWNELVSTSDLGVLQQKMIVMDEGSVLNPSNGRPMPMRTDWRDKEGDPMIEKDYEWKNGTLNKNIDVPSDAVVYNSSSNKWENIGSGVKSAVKITYKVIGGKWHSGADLTLRDVMGWHAWSWDMSFKDGDDDEYYQDSFAGRNKERFENIVGEIWNKENQTYTVWGDYTLPIDEKIGDYFSIWPTLHYTQYMAVQELVTKGQFAPSGIKDWRWTNKGDIWVDWTSKNQGETIKEALQNMMDADFIPWFMREENNAPITVSSSELNDERKALIDFYDEHDHMFASQGPFLMDKADPEEMYVKMSRFTQEDGYPWPEDKWVGHRPITDLIVSRSHVPKSVTISDPLNVSYYVKIDKDYPQNITRNVTAGDHVTATIKLLNSLDEVVAEITPRLENSTLYGTFDTKGLSQGEYTVRFEGYLPMMTGHTLKTEKVILVDKITHLKISDFEVKPSEIEPGSAVTITATAENTYDDLISFDIMFDGESIAFYEIEPGVSLNIEETYTFDDPGTYIITVGDKAKEIVVGSPNLIVEDLEVQSKGFTGDKITILADIENTGTIGLENSVFIDGEAVRDFTLEAGESQDLAITHTFDSAGTYTIKIGNKAAEIEIVNAIVVEEMNLSEDKIRKGDKVVISAKITNNDGKEREVEIKIDGEAVKTWTVQPGTDDYSYEHKFDEKGKYEVTIGDQPAKEVKVEGKDTPGFTMVSLLLSISLIFLYRWRRKY